MNPIIEKLKERGIIVVFDVDGVLAPYEWGNMQHCVSDEEWDRTLANHKDVYANARPVQTFVDFIIEKGSDSCYVCSCGSKAEIHSKSSFCSDKYGIPAENICIVKKKADKLPFLNNLRDKLGISENRIAIIEDTVETLDEIANGHDYITVHVSSFL